MRLDVQRDVLMDKGIQEIMLQNDFLRYQCQIQDDLLKKNNICTNKLNWGKKQELSERARRLSYQSRKDNIKIAFSIKNGI